MYIKNRGTGLMLLGISDKDENDIALGTLWFVFFFLPIFPIGGRRVKFIPSTQTGFAYEVISKEPLNFGQIIKTYLSGWFASPILLFAPMVPAIMEIWLALGLPKSWHLTYSLFAIAWFIVGVWLMLDRYEAKGMVNLGAGDVLAQKAIRQFKKGQYAAAIPLLEAAQQATLKIHSHSILLTLAGLSYARMNQFEDALNYHQQAIDIDPKNYQAWVNQGLTHRSLKQYAEAEYAYQQALQINPDYAEAHSSLGVLYITQGKQEQAIQHLERAVELDDSVATAQSNLAIGYAIIGHFAKAEQSFNQAIKLGYAEPDVIREKIDYYRGTQTAIEKPNHSTHQRKKHMAYVTIEGVKYEKELLELAEKHTTGKGEGKISKDEVLDLFESALDGQGVTEVEMRTLAFIRETFEFTDAAARLFDEEVTKLA